MLSSNINEMVSVIMPVYNRELFLTSTIEAILDQSYSNFELILVDDHSTDGSLKIIEEFAAKDNRIRVFKRPDERAKGANACRNFGFEMSKGEYIQWVDSDDRMDKEFLSKKVKAFNDQPNINYVVSQTVNIDSEGNQTLLDHKLGDGFSLKSYLEGKSYFLTWGPLFRKSFLSGEELFNETLQRHQEFEFYFRVLLRDKNFKFISDAIMYRQLHQQQLGKISNASGLKRKRSALAYRKTFDAYINGQEDNQLNEFFKARFKTDTFQLIKEGSLSDALISFKYYLRSLNSK